MSAASIGTPVVGGMNNLMNLQNVFSKERMYQLVMDLISSTKVIDFEKKKLKSKARRSVKSIK